VPQFQSLSAVIPFHNFSVNYNNLSKLIKSISSLSIPTIVVADSLNDSEFEELHNLIGNISGLILLRCNFRSAALTRNFGLKLVDTEWVIFCDCDDMVNPSSYSEIMNLPQIKNFDLVVSQIEIESLVTGAIIFRSTTKSMRQLGLLPAFTRVLYRTSFLEGLVFESIPLCEDQCFLAQAISRNPRILFSDLVTYIYKIDNPYQGSNTLFSHKAHICASEFILDLVQPNLTKDVRFTLHQMGSRLLLSALKRLRLKDIYLAPKLLMKLTVVSLKHPIVLLNSAQKSKSGIRF
jgi:glycosyltransferase involved in cell wall biosynthesis